ncbi:polysaccharide biosynthesis protein [Nitrospira moscoviensis]|uniref:Putative polysaccharide biosynthesis protein EpsC n=1 Tax=Nitrospira moscoviensis TaxID=42253 RepID=A0A0K2GFY8_NITMO|nr:nucleoside-diphosphate sugar epimerase/dehydratase [Nitrospira moscoviensis]ALA59875.1 putative polysaccharide biosynthesis protein EpsC [Nitrospira moscoviensis]
MTLRVLAVRLFQTVGGRYGNVLLAYRAWLVFGVQWLLIALANATAFALRFDGAVPSEYAAIGVKSLPIVLLVFGSSLWVFGIQRGLWRYVGLHDLGRILWASVAGVAVVYLVLHGLLGWTQYPRSIIILTGLLSGLYLAGIRLAVRWFREWIRIAGSNARRVLIVGAGNAGELLVRDMLTDNRYHYRPVGFVDDDPVKRRAKIHGVPVIGTVSEIAALARRCQADEVIVAIPSATTSLKQKILAASEGCGVPIKVLPNVKELLDDPASLARIRPMSLEDLLQREPIRIDRQELHPLLEGKTALVTGAGGSIGSELCRQIAQYKPASLVLFERYENALHTLLLELRAAFPHVGVLPVIGDVTMPERVEEVFKQTSPDIVFHAAAHKHVPLMELNPKEAVRNNVLGTRVVAEAAVAAGVDRFVLISTDKAVNPSSVMGATKRIAEHVIRGLGRQGLTKFTVVRFGNVLGSNGSVVPLFAEQIRKGGPVTVTHPDIRRFFMTIPEAVQLVLQASVLGQGGEVFVLDMGEQIRIADLARNMIVLSGLVPGKDVNIIYTGLRAGEKLYEELFEESEQAQPTAHAKVNRAVGAPLQADDLEQWIGELHRRLSGMDEEELLQDLKRFVPTFQPSLPQRVS